MANRDSKGKFTKRIKYIHCEKCQKIFPPYRKYSRFCSRTCFDKYRAEKKAIKKEVESIRSIGIKKVYHYTKRGYVTINLNGKMYYYHRLKMERFMGRKLEKTEQVHHKNGNKSDNSLENLELLTIAEHARLHSTKLPRACTICDKKHYAKGLCRNHYKRKRPIA